MALFQRVGEKKSRFLDLLMQRFAAERKSHWGDWRQSSNSRLGDETRIGVESAGLCRWRGWHSDCEVWSLRGLCYV